LRTLTVIGENKMDKQIAIDSIIDYVFEHEYNDFDIHLKEGDNPKDHIYYCALILHYNANIQEVNRHIKEEFKR